jgi:CRP/FNR family transcriptional regulator, cyclic AMP receptor protein
MVDATRSIVDLLAASSVLGGLPRSEIEALAGHAHARTFARGAVVCRRGDTSDTLFVVTAGRVKVSIVTSEARDITLNFLGPGDLIGEIAVLDGGARTADVTALEKTEAMLLHRRDLMPVLLRNPPVLLEIIGVLCEKLRHASALVEDSSLALSRRMAAAVHRLSQQHGRKRGEEIVIDLRLSQSELATYAGLSRENVNRQLALLRDRHVIRMEDHKLVVIDEAALLAQVADGDDL